MSSSFLFAQDPKVVADLESRGKGSLESRTVTVCSGLDLVNIDYNNFVAADEATADVWTSFSASSSFQLSS